jgi:hypothetical protein
MATTTLDERAAMDKVVSDTSRAPLRGLAVGSAVVGAILAVCAVMWYRTPLANVLSEGAGISVTSALAAINERPDHREVWRVLERTLHGLGRAYAAGLVVAQSAMSQRTDVAGTSAANQFDRPTDG